MEDWTIVVVLEEVESGVDDVDVGDGMLAMALASDTEARIDETGFDIEGT